jgi:hypothetical protein
VELAAGGHTVSSVARAVSGAAGRVLPQRRGRYDEYVLCPEDRYWFRPAYTEGKCPLCGEVAPGGVPPAPLLRRMDRSWFGVAGLAVESLCMLALVLFMYFKG